MGLNLENCELWFERAVLAFMMIMVVLIVIRVCAKPTKLTISSNEFYVPQLHFLIALSNYYSYLSRNQNTGLPMHMLWCSQSMDDSHQHIYLLPRSSTFHAAATPKTGDDNDILVYAPVPLSSMSPQQAQNLRTTATEAWISRTEPSSASSSSSLQTSRSHRYGHRRHGSSGGSSGRISLPVRPDEGLLPAYEDSMGCLFVNVYHRVHLYHHCPLSLISAIPIFLCLSCVNHNCVSSDRSIHHFSFIRVCYIYVQHFILLFLLDANGIA
jgi:hypothetical protein